VGGSLPEPAATSSTLSSAPTIARYPAGDTVSLELVSGADLEDLSYQEIYRKTIPSVVTVRTILTSSYGVGTGIILTSDGYILTNSHVIENGSSVVVVLNSGAEYQAKLVGRDSETDLAVLKIGAAHLTPAEFGDPDELVVGDEALAIGNPLGEQLRGTLTNGIISAINRNVSVNGRTMTLIQTTAALNEGNSGGPLINLKGQVIGINTIKMMSTYSTIEGLGFAIPISSAKPIVEELISQGYLTARLTIGIYGVAWTEPEGVRVDSVIDGTGAADAGLQSDDVITAINGTHVANVDQVNDIKSNFKPGDFLTMTVDRDGETLTLEVEIRDQNDIE
jgi:serine protease Do